MMYPTSVVGSEFSNWLMHVPGGLGGCGGGGGDGLGGGEGDGGERAGGGGDVGGEGHTAGACQTHAGATHDNPHALTVVPLFEPQKFEPVPPLPPPVRHCWLEKMRHMHFSSLLLCDAR